MRRYETIVIVDPDVTEENRSSLLTRIREVIPQQGGEIIQEDLWGTRKLAYEIKKKPRGYYARYDYCGSGLVVDELERFFRIDDRVMKYLTVQLSDEADIEKIKAEIAAAQAKKDAPAQEKPAGGDSSRRLGDDSDDSDDSDEADQADADIDNEEE